MSSTDQGFRLLRREGSRPGTTRTNPHEQLDQNAPGWAERHPLAGRFAPPTTVMVYGPRDADELEVVWRLVRQSHRFASGETPLPADYGDDPPLD